MRKTATTTTARRVSVIAGAVLTASMVLDSAPAAQADIVSKNIIVNTQSTIGSVHVSIGNPVVYKSCVKTNYTSGWHSQWVKAGSGQVISVEVYRDATCKTYAGGRYSLIVPGDALDNFWVDMSAFR